MSGHYNLQLVKILLTSIDDVEMRRLKEGFYNIMKISNVVKDKGLDAKKEIIEFSQNNKIEKPVTEPVIILKTSIQYAPIAPIVAPMVVEV